MKSRQKLLNQKQDVLQHNSPLSSHLQKRSEKQIQPRYKCPKSQIGESQMIAPNKVAAMAEKKEKENYAFRTFLKNHADPDKLDAQFLRLHNELFSTSRKVLRNSI